MSTATNPHPIQQNWELRMKRPASPLDTDSSKKRKLEAPDTEVETSVSSHVDGAKKVQNIADGDVFSAKVYRSYVKNALDALDKNDTNPLQALTSKITTPQSKSNLTNTHLQFILQALTADISRLDNRNCTPLISSIIQLKWSTKPQSFIDIYIRFIIVLVSGIPKWWSEIANKLISQFINKNTEPHHLILKQIKKLIPTTISILPSIFIKYFPHIKSFDNKLNILNYIENLLKTMEYLEEINFTTWSLIFEKSIQLDVELQNQLDDLDDDLLELSDDEDDDNSSKKVRFVDKNGNELETNEEIENENDEDDIKSGYESDESDYCDEIIDSKEKVNELVSKLDSIMVLIFKYLEKNFTIDSINNGNGIIIFNTFLTIFKTHILNTHYTKSIQFLLFKITQLSSELIDTFLVLLIDISFNQNETIEKKLKSMQYVASFISRSKKITKFQISFIISYLKSWMEKYVDEREVEIFDVKNSLNGMERFKMFYGVFQTILYIFCYRHEILKNDEDDDENCGKWDCDLDKFFTRMINSNFNPLKYCDETIVLIFAKIAQVEGIVYCYSVIEKNKQEKLNCVLLSNQSNEQQNQKQLTKKQNDSNSKIININISLNSNNNISNDGHIFTKKHEFIDLEAYFPFDPLVLKKTKLIIKDVYLEWSDVSGEYDSESDSDFDDEFNEKGERI